MRKWLRIILIGGGIIIGLVLLLVLGLTWYIHANKATFLKQITSQLNGEINGTLTIADMDASLWRSFPHVSLGLQKVVLQDSGWQQHHHALVDVNYIFVRVNTLSLLRKHVEVSDISLNDGTIYLFTDSTGYSNTYVFQGKSSGKSGGTSKDANIQHLSLEKIHFFIENHQKQKLFHLDINHLAGHMQATDTALHFTMLSDMLAKDFAFNTTKGSYLKDKTLQLNLSLSFDKRTKVMTVPQQEIRINDRPVLIGGQFSFDRKPPAFHLKITAQQVLLKEAASWLSPNITAKLNNITLSKPLDAEADLQGHLKYRDTPRVVVTWKTNDNVLQTTMGEWTHCDFTGRFNNEVIPDRGHNDENSAVNIFGLRADVAGVTLKADTIRVVNLKQPLLHGHFQSQFMLADLNDPGGDIPLTFKGGSADADLYYTGPLLKDDNTPSSLEGLVHIQKGAFTYLPRNLSFQDCSATLRFTGKDLLLQNIRIQSGKSTLLMDGKIANLLNLYFTAPEKIDLDWNIRSPLVDLNEFKSFLGLRKKGKRPATAQQAKMSRVSKQLDAVLEASNARMEVKLDKVVFNHFTAQQVKASLALTQTDILLKQIALQHAGGNITLTGKVQQQGKNNTFQINTNINNVHIGQLFYAFDNFGMQALQSTNLRGIIAAKANIRGNILDDGTLAKRSLFGTINFNLKQGALVNFGPLEDIGNFVFRRRRLDSITFENLSNTFRVEGNKILIPAMRIASSAVNIDVDGVYGIDGGTNINLAIPLRNPARDSAITDPEEKRRRSKKGIVIRLHAAEGKDGKVKIKLGKGSKEGQEE
ncbi:AsmA family protein [Chitinophaga nivalis]|uniref:AsmA family protein n=1 Tax=Chitinophaga nivalis TaxID=2991709 RepID=A0ABT3ILD1_9BACT|nr:AsmA family protein [Chitinophaga nivalis]MCW3465724.1 AsmA family protein [Chitinophaga nivalis]MCW3484585.1 AsmA family protein [Chitinophaga nivalis]